MAFYTHCTSPWTFVTFLTHPLTSLCHNNHFASDNNHIQHEHAHGQRGWLKQQFLGAAELRAVTVVTFPKQIKWQHDIPEAHHMVFSGVFLLMYTCYWCLIVSELSTSGHWQHGGVLKKTPDVLPIVVWHRPIAKKKNRYSRFCTVYVTVVEIWKICSDRAWRV